MSEPGLTANNQPNHGPPDPPFTSTLPVRSVIDEQCDRDQGLLETLTFRCGECRRHGPAKDGKWHLISGVIYCDACFMEESQT